MRLIRGSKSYEFLHDWIQEGAKDDPGATPAVRLEILPESRVLIAPAATQQLVVFVYDSNNKPRDVTPICYYDSSNPEIAEVNAEGYVRFKSRGEVAIIAHYLNLVANIRLTHLVEVPGFVQAEVPQDNVIDRAVFNKLNRMRIRPSEPCTDREFIRRVYLDVIGVLPAPDEVARFLKEPAKTRRDSVIDSLLARPEFYDFWALKFADILRSNGRLIESKGAYVFHRWIRTCLERDIPMNEFVRELLTAEGSTYKNPAANYYRISRDPGEFRRDDGPALPRGSDPVRQVPQPPVRAMDPGRLLRLRRILLPDRSQEGQSARRGSRLFLRFGRRAAASHRANHEAQGAGRPYLRDAPQNRDRRTRLASWLAGAENPFFGKSLVNRIWFHLMGRGIVEPVDDFRDSNPASNDELLNGLTSEFIKNGYHLKALVRSIVRSRAYQLSATTNSFNVDDSLYFSHARPSCCRRKSCSTRSRP